MAELKVRDIEKSMKKKGFQLDKKSGNTDHKYYRLYNLKGEKTCVTTKISHGEDSIRDPLIKEMSTQLGLKKRQFEEYVQCTLSYEKYLKKCKHLK